MAIHPDSVTQTCITRWRAEADLLDQYPGNELAVITLRRVADQLEQSMLNDLPSPSAGKPDLRLDTLAARSRSDDVVTRLFRDIVTSKYGA